MPGIEGRLARLERLAAGRDFDPPALARIACQVYAGRTAAGSLDPRELEFIAFYVHCLVTTEPARQFAPDAPCPGHWTSS